jgi:DNA polymerase-3 subunit gamma/tau
MSYQVLARKWRPRRFAEVVGQEHVVRALDNALTRDQLHHAYLFTGTRGVGKTTLARIFAKSLNCEQGVSAEPCGTCSACREIDEGRFADLLEVDAASRTKVDQTRELLDNVPYAPVRGRYKVYLIDEVHMFSGHSFNALLKTLEEPPPHVKFLLATTDPQKLPVTVLSRCLQFNLRRLLPEEIRDQLGRVLEQEGIEHESRALGLLARAADGSMRDGLSLLDQAIAHGGGRVAEAEVRAMLGTLSGDRILELAEALAQASPPRVLDLAARLADQAPDFAEVLRELLGLLHRLAVAQVVPDTLGAEADPREQALARALAPEDVQLYYQIGLLGQRDLELAPDPRAGLEMVLLRMLAFRPDGAAAAPPRPPLARAGVAEPANAVHEPRAGPPPAGALGAQDWQALLRDSGLQGIARQLANHCVPESWDGATLRLALDPAGEGVRAAVAEQRLIQAIRDRLGAAVRVEIQVRRAQAETPAQRDQREQEGRQAAAQDSIRDDALVRGLQERFGASLVADSVRPREDD